MTAKQYLDKYRELVSKIRAISEQIERLREFLTGTSSGGSNGSGGSRSQDKMGDITADIVDMEREKDAMMDELVEMQVVIRRNLSRITNSKIRSIIECRYINGYSYEKIAAMERCDVRTVLYRHRAGLKLLDENWDDT